MPSTRTLRAMEKPWDAKEDRFSEEVFTGVFGFFVLP
jgi:hypothetical protein